VLNAKAGLWHAVKRNECPLPLRERKKNHWD